MDVMDLHFYGSASRETSCIAQRGDLRPVVVNRTLNKIGEAIPFVYDPTWLA